MNSKSGIFTSYVIAGGTGTVGAASLNTAEQAHAMAAHPFFGHPLSEVAIVIGIIGTISTMVFQYLNYRRIKQQSKTGDSDK